MGTRMALRKGAAELEPLAREVGRRAVDVAGDDQTRTFAAAGHTLVLPEPAPYGKPTDARAGSLRCALAPSTTSGDVSFRAMPVGETRRPKRVSPDVGEKDAARRRPHDRNPAVAQGLSSTMCRSPGSGCPRPGPGARRWRCRRPRAAAALSRIRMFQSWPMKTDGTTDLHAGRVPHDQAAVPRVRKVTLGRADHRIAPGVDRPIRHPVVGEAQLAVQRQRAVRCNRERSMIGCSPSMMNSQFPTLPSVARPLYSQADPRSISSPSSEDTS
jgi:hypothetical protein